MISHIQCIEVSFSGVSRGKRPGGPAGFGHLALPNARRDDIGVETPVSARDVTTIMVTLGDIRADLAVIRRLMEEENGQEEGDEADA
jgi:hypothetical protein